MYRLAITAETRLPMAPPPNCSQIDPLYWKYVDLNTRFRRSAILAGVSVLRSARVGSSFIFCSTVCTAASIGKLVNSDLTSKDTMISLSRIVSLPMVDTK